LLALYSTHAVRLVSPPHLTKHKISEKKFYLIYALAASCPVASYSAGPPSKQVSSPETHHSPVAYSFSYIVVAYSTIFPTVPAPASTLVPDSITYYRLARSEAMANGFLSATAIGIYIIGFDAGLSRAGLEPALYRRMVWISTFLDHD